VITKQEIKQLACDQDVPISQIEKDYVMGWILWGIYQDFHFSRTLILKGGNCLRKVYFPETRFSDDLDFTATRLDTTEFFQKRFSSICSRISQQSGIVFDDSRLRVEEKETPHDSLRAMDGRIYFKGLAGDQNITFRIKLDISEFEKIVLPVQQHQIRHPYSDQHECEATIFCYSLEEILAEKLRSWIQRTRSRDLYDVVAIIQGDSVTYSKSNVLKAFTQKTIFKGIPATAKEDLLENKKFQVVESHWDKSISCPKISIMFAVNAIQAFKDFINLLFSSPENVLQYVPFESFGRVSPEIRETIIEAGKARKLIRLRYSLKDRDVEPYEIKYHVRKVDNRGFEYFIGWDLTRGNHIKKYFLHKIESVSIINQAFSPKYPVLF
jgi:predicted nucleotidyltransferase component of viral defense system